MIQSKLASILRYLTLSLALIFPAQSFAGWAHGSSGAPFIHAMGTNLAAVFYFTTNQPYMNILKTGGGWFTNNSSGETGEEAYLYSNMVDSNNFPISCSATGTAV